jgi:hypothetical protein
MQVAACWQFNLVLHLFMLDYHCNTNHLISIIYNLFGRSMTINCSARISFYEIVVVSYKDRLQRMPAYSFLRRLALNASDVDDLVKQADARQLSDRTLSFSEMQLLGNAIAAQKMLIEPHQALSKPTMPQLKKSVKSTIKFKSSDK